MVRATDINSYNLDSYRNQVFGPYTSASVGRVLLQHCRKTFGYCLQPFNNRQKACFNYHLGHCPGACIHAITSKEYQTHLGLIKKFLSGKFASLKKTLQLEISKAAKLQNFEKAEIIKKQYQSLDGVLQSGSSSLLLKLSDSNFKSQSTIVKTLSHPKLNQTPKRIECYDLAHLQGTNYVGAMTVMIMGKLANTEYRQFHISSQSTSDPHAMKEILTRRFQHPEWSYPDLIILDGGVSQLNTVLPVIPNNIPVVALAKKKETLIFYDQNNKLKQLQLSLENPVLNQFITLRNEAHRFGNSFHRKQRSKSMVI